MFIDTISVKFLGCENGIVVMQGNVPVCRRSMMKRFLGSEKSTIYFPVVQGKKYIYIGRNKPNVAKCY